MTDNNETGGLGNYWVPPSEQIDQIIERVKSKYLASNCGKDDFQKLAAYAIMPIISDRERLKAELSKAQEKIKHLRELIVLHSDLTDEQLGAEFIICEEVDEEQTNERR